MTVDDEFSPTTQCGVVIFVDIPTLLGEKPQGSFEIVQTR